MTKQCNCSCNCDCIHNICCCNKKLCNLCSCLEQNKEECNFNQISYYDNTYLKNDCLNNLNILENQFSKIKSSVIKYVSSISELTSVARQQSDKSIKKIEKILKNLEYIQNSFINEIVIAGAMNLSDNKDCIPVVIARKGENHNSYNTLLYSGLDAPKEFNILLNCNQKINLFHIPSLRIDLDNDIYLSLKITEISNSSSHNSLLTFIYNDVNNNVYNLSNEISDIKTEFYRDVEGNRVSKDDAELHTSFDYLLQYLYSITGYVEGPLYKNLHIENVIDDFDLIINHIKSIKRSPILHN
jgi:hypothetical protein